MDDFDGVTVTFAIIGFIIFGIIIAHYYVDNDISKDKCYEIYTTDNVILKECEEYFK